MGREEKKGFEKEREKRKRERVHLLGDGQPQ